MLVRPPADWERHVLLVLLVTALLGASHGAVLASAGRPTSPEIRSSLHTALRTDQLTVAGQQGVQQGVQHVKRRSLSTAVKLEQEREIASQIRQAEQAARDETLAQEEEIARQIKQAEKEAGSGDKVAKEETIATQIQQAEKDAGIGDKLAQEAEIARQIKQAEKEAGIEDQLAQEREIASQIAGLRAEAGRADRAHKLAQEAEIARQIAEAEAEARRDKETKLAQEAVIAHQIRQAEAEAGLAPVAPVAPSFDAQGEIAREMKEMVAAHPRIHHPVHLPFGQPGDGVDAEKASEDDDDDGTDTADSSDDAAEDVSVDDYEDDSDEIYDDFFDKKSDSVAAGRDGDTSATPSPADVSRTAGAVGDVSAQSAGGSQGHAPPAASAGQGRSPGGRQDEAQEGGQGRVGGPGQGRVTASRAPGKQWQVTAMAVILCSVVGCVMLVTVGLFVRHVSFRPLRRAPPDNLLLEDDEDAVYNSTTRLATPNRVGRYTPLT